MPDLKQVVLEHEAIARFVETWAANCGAPRYVFTGQLGTVIAELLRDRDKVWCEAIIPEGGVIVNRVMTKFNEVRPDDEDSESPLARGGCADGGFCPGGD